MELKERALVLLLRNIDVNSGLCNGTTMKVISIITLQLYVALSRAGIPHKTKVMIINIKDTEGSFEIMMKNSLTIMSALKFSNSNYLIRNY